MEKIKNFLNPGKDVDDEILYGSGQHAPGKGFSGEGSHFSQETSTTEPTTSDTSGLGGSSTAGHSALKEDPAASATTGVGSSSTRRDEPVVSSSTAAGSSTVKSPHDAPTSSNAPLESSTATQVGTSGQRLDDNASMASIKSGVHGTGPGSGLTESSTSAGDLNTNKPLPHAPESSTATGTGLAGSTLPEHREEGSSDPSTGVAAVGATSTDRSFPLGSGSSTATHLGGHNHPTETTATSTAGIPPSGQTSGLTDTSTSGAVQSSAGNAPSTSGTSHVGRDAALGAGALGTAGVASTELHKHREEADQVGATNVPAGTASSEYAPTGGKGIGGTLREGPHPTYAGNEFDPALYGKDGKFDPSSGTTHGTSSGIAAGASTVPSTTVGSSSTKPDHDLSENDTKTTKDTAGPHSSSLLNKLDPRVKSERDGSKTIGGTQTGIQQTSTGPTSTGPTSTGPTSTGPTSTGPTSTGPTSTGPTSTGPTSTGPTSTGPTSTGPTSETATGITSGRTEGTRYDENPYSAKAVDPRLNSHQESDVAGTSSTKDHHYSRDTALAGGGAGLAAGAYEADKHHSESTATTGPSTSTTTTGQKEAVEPSSAGGTSTGAGSSETTTRGPHKSNLLNKLDPRVDSDRDGSKTVGKSGPSSTSAIAPVSSDEKTVSQPTSSATGTKDTHDSHLSRDAAIAGTGAGIGAGAYEGEKHSAGTHPSTGTQQPTSTQPFTGTQQPTSTQPSTGTRHPTSTQPSTTGTSTSTSTTGPHSSDLANRTDPRVDSDRSEAKDNQHHAARDAALIGGTAGAGGATAVHEQHKHAAEKTEKEHQKEVEKEQKASQKEAEKEEKAAHKEAVKEEKAAHKEAVKEEKAAQKAHDKEAKHHEHEHDKSEKKHHGILGLLHRDKTPKEDESRETEDVENKKRLDETMGTSHSHQSTTHADHSHGERNRLHKEPPAEIKAQQEGIVHERITGLPMNPKLGSGVGGTDGAPIEGLSGDRGTGLGSSSTATAGDHGLSASEATHEGTGSTTGIGHGTSTTTGTGPHSSSIENKLDPRVSDRDAVTTEQRSSGALGSSTTGPTESSALETDTGVSGAHGSKGGAGHY